MTVKLNCISMNTKIVLIVSINFEKMTRKKLLVLKKKMMNIKNYIIFGTGNNKLYSCVKLIVPIGR